MNKDYANIAKTYKRRIAGGFMLVDGAKLLEKISGEDFLVTRKFDGEMQIVFYHADGDTDTVEAYGSNGAERGIPLPCFAEFGALCRGAGLTDAVVAAELYAAVGADGRERVNDVRSAIADGQLGSLRLAPFDIISLDGADFHADHYKDTHARLLELFAGDLVAPVAGKAAAGRDEVAAIYDEWVAGGGAEGLVVHCELPFIYKIKRRHSIDAVVMGYTVGEGIHTGMVRDIMVGVMDPEGRLQQFATLGTGLTDQQRTDLYARFSQMHVGSEYVETDSRNVAYRMVRPETTVQISVVDLVAENSKGEPKMNMLVDYSDGGGYTVVAQVPGVAAHSPVFECMRPDKSCNPTDIRLSQLTDLCPFSEVRPVALTGLPESELLARRIFTKGADAKLMIQKYTVWKTNKEHTGVFPAYVFHYTDYSVGRKEPLKRDIRVSDSREQIFSIMERFMADSVKKGWKEV